jgi:hypothetical protein
VFGRATVAVPVGEQKDELSLVRRLKMRAVDEHGEMGGSLVNDEMGRRITKRYLSKLGVIVTSPDQLSSDRVDYLFPRAYKVDGLIGLGYLISESMISSLPLDSPKNCTH